MMISLFSRFLSLKLFFKELKLPQISKVTKGALNSFTRIEHDHFSHFNASIGHLNDIDFIVISAPGWSQLPLHLEVEVGPPRGLPQQRP